ncbi:MAG TPA: sulfite exporter TauE/SafE family protein [Puia sp.]|jgi:sulfite exporter TauE/SafE|nr:sulfite exporter TauE/SafE family protein [Puia sp.]
MWQSFLAAFSIGMLGSMHCVGMCGPLVLALPVRNMGAGQRGLSVGSYHLGRIGIYSLAGLLFGLLGRRVYLAGWQQTMSVGLGVLLLVWIPAKGFRLHGRMPARVNKFYWGLMGWMTRLWQSPSRGKFFLMGMGNGLLPCGMVYLAIAGALTSSSLIQGMGFMFFFGLGTLPLLLILQMSGMMVSVTFRQQVRKALPYLTALVAILLILRGLNLGIPFVSPMLAPGQGPIVECH